MKATLVKSAVSCGALRGTLRRKLSDAEVIQAIQTRPLPAPIPRTMPTWPRPLKLRDVAGWAEGAKADLLLKPSAAQGQWTGLGEMAETMRMISATRLAKIEERLNFVTAKDPNDERNVFLEVRAGTVVTRRRSSWRSVRHVRKYRTAGWRIEVLSK